MLPPAAGGRKKTLRGSRLPEQGGSSRIFFPQAAFAALDWAFALIMPQIGASGLNVPRSGVCYNLLVTVS